MALQMAIKGNGQGGQLINKLDQTLFDTIAAVAESGSWRDVLLHLSLHVFFDGILGWLPNDITL